MKGFVILFAVLLVSITLSISLSLFNITFKQLVLSNVARDSQFAYFATDSALDCSRHWDVYPPAPLENETTTERPFGYLKPVDLNGDAIIDSWEFIPPDERHRQIECGGKTISVHPTDDNGDDIYTTDFELFWLVDASEDRYTCAIGQVEKNAKDDNTIKYRTTIRVQGYNLSNGIDCPTLGDRTVERALRFDE